jgi:3-hydroxyisobutyrate dehydrogenase
LIVIAFFGMGLLGANFVRACRVRGEAVQVWNRTAAKASALESIGVRAFPDPAQAAAGAARIHLTLPDDAVVDEVLARAETGFAPGVVIVDHSTTSPAGTRARARHWQERGVAFLHAPVFMGPQNALEGTGIMLASGDPDRVERLRPALEAMTGKLLYLGAEPERAASFKLLGNLMLMFLTAGVTEMLALAKALGIQPGDAAALFDAFNPGASLPARAQRVLAADYDHPSWELAMARKDARLMLEAGAQGGDPLPMLQAIATVMDGFLQRGHGHDDWTVIAKDALAR